MSDKRAESLWRYLAATSRQPEMEIAAPPGFARRVLERLPQSFVLLRLSDERHGRQRIVSTAAWMALAASLLICLWSWQDLRAAWTDVASNSVPSVFEPGVEIELWDD